MMNRYKVDLHIHTCLSPCGSLDMSPAVLIERALDCGLSAIAVTDHNTTLQCREIQALGEECGLTVFAGVEVTTKEEAHCLVLFPDDEKRQAFQVYLDEHLPHIPNNPEYFGDQVWVDRHEEIAGEVPWLLISSINRSVNQIAAYARQLDCLFIPAHVERPSYSLIGQLGFIDPSLPVDAIEYNNPELYAKLLQSNPYLKRYTQYQASDAHNPEQIGSQYAILEAPSLTFAHLRMGLRKENGCRLYSE